MSEAKRNRLSSAKGANSSPLRDPEATKTWAVRRHPDHGQQQHCPCRLGESRPTARALDWEVLTHRGSRGDKEAGASVWAGFATRTSGGGGVWFSRRSPFHSPETLWWVCCK